MIEELNIRYRRKKKAEESEEKMNPDLSGNIEHQIPTCRDSKF